MATLDGTGSTEASTVPVPDVVPLASDDLLVRFPEHDFDGYWFFGGLESSEPYEAVVFGLSLGANDGYDWGFRPVVPDPDFGIVAVQVVAPSHAVGFGLQPVHRHRFRYNRRRPHIALEHIAHLRIDGDGLEVAFASPDVQLELELAGRLPTHAVWTPDMIFRGTCFVSVAIPGIEFEGVLRVGTGAHHLRGVGTLDHPMGTLRRSEVSRGMGWWEYNSFRLDGGHGLFQWFIEDREGGLVLDAVATDLPDGELRAGRVALRYVEWQERGPVAIPVRWEAEATFPHGTARYVVTVAGPPWDGAPHERGTPYPNFVLRLEGTFTERSGQVHPLGGTGTGETVVSERDPHRRSPQEPW